MRKKLTSLTTKMQFAALSPKWLSLLLCVVTISQARAQTEIMANGGFESGSSSWTLSGEAGLNGLAGSSQYAHAGSYYLILGGAVSETDAAYQTVTIPSGATAAALSFYYNISSAEGITTTYDTFSATIRNTSGSILATVGPWSNRNKDPAAGNPYYHQQTFNMLPYAGQSVRIYFSSVNDSTYITSFRIDDVSLQVTTPSAPTISSSSPLPAGIVGAAYNQTLTATGSTTPYSWSVTSGSLPAGLSLNSAGILSGTPTAATTANFTVQVTGNGFSSTKALALAINDKPWLFSMVGLPQSQASAQLYGNFNPNGLPTTAWFEWGNNIAYGKQTVSAAKGSGTTISQHSDTIYGLSCGATYHFRIVAQNSAGTSYGNDQIFTMPAAPIVAPNVQTLAVDSLTANGANLRGNVNPNGSPCSIWFQWGTTASYGNRTPGYSYGGTAASYISAAEFCSDLAANQTYHVRICASNAAGVTYGSDTNFTTIVGSGTALTVTTPNGGESVQAGTSLPISWSMSGNTASISGFWIEYSTTSGAPWTPLSYWSAVTRSATWSIPFGIASSQTRIRVRAFDAGGNTIASDTSDSDFTITSGVTRPHAVPTANNNAPVSGTTVTFSSSGSHASSGTPTPTITSYEWDFGNGVTANGATATHSFTATGTRTFYVTLTVTDSAGQSDTKTLAITVTGQALGANTQQSKSQDPVNLATGNFIYDHTDTAIPGIGFPFELKRTYNSKASQFSGPPLGYCWTHSYNMQLSVSNSAVTVLYGDGRSESYTNVAGAYVAEAGIFNTLTANGTGGYILTTKEQVHYNFDSLNRLASIVDKNSNTLSLAYNGNGALAVITNSSGRVITFVNDSNNRIIRTIDPLNRTNSFAYNAQGDLASATDPRGGITRYGYDDNHQMTNAVDPNGNQFVRNVYANNKVVQAQRDAFGNMTTFTYDFVTRITIVSNSLGACAIHQHDDKLRVIQITDETGKIQNFEYDGQNNRTKVIDKNRRATTYTYDAMGNVISKTDPKNNMTSISYDPLNNPINRTDALNGVTLFVYDGKGNLTQTVNAQYATNTVTYESRGLPQLIRDANGNSVSNSYDSAGNLIATRDVLGYVRSNVYDSLGRKLFQVDPNNGTNWFTYDANNNLLTSVDPLGNTNSFVYDANNNQVCVRDARNFQTAKIYDAKDRLICISNALSGIIVNAYDALDRKITTTDPLGNVTRFAYDPVGNLIAVSNALGQVTYFNYDANGNQNNVINALGRVTTSEYNDLNRLVKVTNPIGFTTRYAYDALGRRTQIMDANSQITQFNYDSLGHLTNVIDAANGTVTFSYDKVGNRISMTEPNGHVTAFTYDALNRLIQKQEPIGTYRTMYDGVGNRITTVDALSHTNRYIYDANNRLRSIIYPTGTPVTFAYDPNGNRTNMTDSLGVSTYNYDALNRVTNCTDSAGQSVGYTYDTNGNRKTMTYPGNHVVAYTFDPLDRMTSVRDWLNNVTTNTYDVAGNLVLIHNPNGTTAHYGFDAAGRLTSLTNACPDATAISSYNLTLDGVGNHLQSAQTEPLDPIIPTQTISYVYDNDNRLTNTTTAVFTYDANGNMLAKGVDTFNYDYENRLTQATVAGTNYLYQYDGLGNRMRATRNGSTTRYVLDVNGTLSHVLTEADAGGAITAYYIYGRGLVSRIATNGTTSYYHYDVRGSIVALSDATGAITDKYAYDPFGNLANRTGTSANPFKYVGRYGVMDEGNGLSYIRARYYSPELGRFVTKDPFAGIDDDSQSMNRFVYALNNPLIYIDASGYFAWDTLWTGVGQIGMEFGYIGLGLVEAAGAGVEFSTGEFGSVKGVSSTISSLDTINSATKASAAGMVNIVRAFLDKNAVSIESQKGAFDDVKQNEYVQYILAGNKVFKVATLGTPKNTANDIASAIGVLQSANGFSETTKLLAMLQLIKGFKTITSIPGDLADLKNVTGEYGKSLCARLCPELTEAHQKATVNGQSSAVAR